MKGEINHASPDQEGDGSAARRGGEYVVVARRYRPQSFDELVGQQTVARALCKAIETNRVGHAYLFTGARGVGKTSAARILAKALNCIKGPTPSPCNACDICDSVSTGDDIDVLEIDGASNRGIDEIRQLRSNVNVRPSRTRFKIYIIDEVHMLTKEAFNALLKTLEEPPEHVKFVFCTTDPEKIPITVLSRCQRFDFVPVEPSAIVQRLEQIVAAEEGEADREALELLARRAAGSVRDSQSLLEQLLSFSGDRITVEDVHRMFGTASSRRLAALVRHLIDRDAASALIELDTAVNEGVDVGQLTEQLLGYVRDMMAVVVGCDKNLMLHATAAEYAAIEEAAQQWGLETLLAVIQILDHTLTRMRQSTHSRTLAEMAVVRIANLDDLDSLSEIIAQLQEGRLPRAMATQGAEGGRHDSQVVKPVKKKLDDEKCVVADDSWRNGPQDRVESVPAPKADLLELTGDSALSVWQRALASLDDMTAEFAGQFESVAISAPNRLVVSFPAKYNSSKTYCERPERQNRLQQALAAVTGRNVQLEFQLISEDIEETPTSRPELSAREKLRQSFSDPLVQRAMELFGAEITRVG